jgi:uncharacterized protein
MSLASRRPATVAILLVLAWILVADAGVLAVRAVAPGIDWQPAALVGLGAVSVLLVIGLTAARWWGEAGVNGPSHWRELRLLVPPLLLSLLPLLAGINIPAAGTLAVLVAGYALTGFAEEAFARGVLIRLLRPRGVVRALVIAAILFGCMHLGNVLIRGNVAVIAAQAVGAAVFGFAYGVLRLRTNSVVPLMGLHFVFDLVLQLSTLPLIAVNVAQDVLLLGYALWLLRPNRATAGVTADGGDGVAEQRSRRAATG